MITDRVSFEAFKKDKNYKYDFREVKNPDKYLAEKKALGYEIYKEKEKLPSGKFRVHYRIKLADQPKKEEKSKSQEPVKTNQPVPKVTVSQINKLAHRIKNTMIALEATLEIPPPRPHWTDWYMRCEYSASDAVDLTKKTGVYWKIDNPLLASQIYHELLANGVKPTKRDADFSIPKPMYLALA